MSLKSSEGLEIDSIGSGYLSDKPASLWPAWLILVLALLLTLGIWRWSQHRVDEQARGEFASRAADIRGALDFRIRAYQGVLRGAAGLFAASDDVTRAQWHSYAEALTLKKSYPAIQAMAFASAFSGEDLTARIKQLRKSDLPDFSVRPPGKRDQYVVKTRQTNLRIGGATRLTPPGRQDSMTTGSYLASKLRGSNSAARLKRPMGGRCPMRK